MGRAQGRALALLATLLSLQAAAALGDVSTATYACDRAKCKAPACACASTAPPGGLPLDQVPQFILLSHDNALDGLPYELMQRVLGNATQPNGCPVPVTWFAQHYHSDCEAGQAALARGDEVAMQANRFPPSDPFTATDPSPKYDSRDPATGQPSVEREILMSREWWAGTCGLPLHAMVGFRAQEHHNNPAIRRTLAQRGFLYDSTLIDWWFPNSATSPAEGERLWPYTMDAGIPQQCDFLGPDVGKCAEGERYPGLWEVPLWAVQEGDTNYGFAGGGGVGINDPKVEGAPLTGDLAGLLKRALDTRLAGNRAPLQVSTYYEWLGDKPKGCATEEDPNCFQVQREPSDNARALQEFIKHTAGRPEVRWVTHSDLVRWMQDPVPLDQFDAWVDCKTPGVKADLSAVNLTAAQMAGAYYIKGAGAATAGAAPAPAPAGAQQPAGVLPPVADAGMLQEGAPSAEEAGDLLESTPSPASAPGPEQAAPAPRPFLRD